MTEISRYLPFIEQLSLQTLTGAGAAMPVRRARETGKRPASSAIPGSYTYLVAKLNALDPDDTQRTRRAFAAYMSFALAERLGEDVINDPDFDSLVENVVTHFESDARLAEVMTTTAEMLILTSA